ncbi:hematopoietically-expressed homeobox protein HHEX-like isoform X2 [Hyposmocoma kahamanoa]|uniref:hematopoietically-expressed homeobox protein HHEX-like isoform X2 n=1 Tax=Hyposmocoma kahamanoa TaxID=1477025 RepID=UPI000E6D9F3F|nr:hematopoietically-expressed homeobox protein HHEX-like isoform X2 [Hyposmocoma kahamanoa]
MFKSPTSVYRSRRSGRHARVPFTAAQAIALEAAYARAPYLAPPALRALAAALQLRDDRIKIWFQNRRARERREKSATITPPQAVTLPPTSQSAVLANNASGSHVSLDLLGIPSGFINSVVYPHDITSPLRISKQNSFEDTNDDSERPETPLDIENVDS